MPTYEYLCDACGHDFEQLQRMSDPAVRKCPKCRKLKVRRIISGGAGVIFKGSGFYETDYKRKRGGAHGPKHRDEGHAGEGKSETSAKPDTKPESKPDAKAEPKSESHHAKRESGKKDSGKKA